MALIKADRVKETSTSTGTGTIALAGAATGYRAFSAVCAVGDTCYYAIAHQTAGEWEVGLATYSAANTLTRTTVHASSNSNLAVTFSAGTKDVFLSVTKAWLDAFLTTTSATTNYVAKATGTGTIGDSQIYDNGTNVGIGTASPDSYGAGLTVYRSVNSSVGLTVVNPSPTSAASASIVLGSAVSGGAYGVIGRNNNYFTGSGLYDSPSTLYIDSSYNNLQLGSYASYAIKLFTNNTQRAIVSAAGLVGINETSPGAQLQVTTAAAATKGLIVKGASAQSANLLELQNSSGIVLASISSSGNAVLSSTSASDPIIYQLTQTGGNTYGAIGINRNTGDGVATGLASALVIRSGDATGYPIQFATANNVRATIDASGNVGIGTTSPAHKLDISHTSTNLLQLKQTAYNHTNLQFYSYHGSLVLAGGGVGLLIYDRDGVARFNIDTFNRKLGINTTSPSAATHSVCDASTTKGLIVQGASGQSANLQEWQNNSGTALAYINSSGSIVAPEFYGSVYAPVIADTNGVGYYKQYFITRTLPDTVGDYVEFLEYNHTVGTRFKIDVMTADYPYWDNAAYEFNVVWDGASSIMPPKFRYHRNTSDFVLEKAYGQSSPYQSRLRLRRIGAKSHASSTTVRIRVEVWATSVGGFPTDASATGTSTLSSYGSDQSFCNPILQVPPQLVSGSGSSLSLYAGSASGTGNGGDIILQSGSLATSGVGGGIALKPTASSAGQYSSSVQFGYLNRYTPSHYTFERMLPNTVGDYVELFSFNAADSSWVEFDVLIWKHAEAYGSKSYKISGSYMQSSGLIQPVGNGIENRGYAGFFNNIFEVELAYPDSSPGTIRLRRTAAGGTNVYAYVYVRAQTLGLIEKSGTGTSSFGLTNPNSTHLTFPTLITPMPVPGGNGSGFSMTLKARDAAGTGNGGSILLQAGAFATSGSNGKVIVRGLASNTANLQEWQNNAGTALVYISSDGSVIGTPSACSIGANDNSGGQIKLYGSAQGYGVGIRQTSLDGDVVLIRTGQVTISPGQGGNNAALLVTGNVNASGSVATFTNSGDVGSRVIIAKGKASQTGNLQEWQNSSGTALASVDASGNINAQAITNFGRLDTYFDSWYGSINRRVYRVDVPSTVGNFREIFKLNWHSNTIAKIKVYAFGSGVYNAKEYDFNSTYGSEGVLLPSRSAYLYNTISVQYELESKWDPATGYNTIRVKRTAGTDALALLVYVEVLDATSGHPIAASGTGTSSIGGILGSYSSFNSIAPPDVVGGNGSGYNLNLYGGAGLGTGNGGSIILQAGAYSTSGSNGKVIVRGLASNTANLQEWQNNAGTALTTIDSAGRIGVGTAPQAGYSLYGTGSIYAGGGGVLVAGNAGLFYLNGRVGIGTGTGTPVFGCEYTNYMRPIILSGYPDGAGYIGTIINTSNTYANATAKLLSVQNNGTEKFSISSNGSITVGEPGESAGGPFTVAVAASGSNTVATKGQRHGRNLIIRAGDSDNYAGVSGGDTYIRAGAPVSPATTYGTIYIGDTGGYTSISGMVQPSSTPAALTADQNNLALTASGFQRLSGTAARTITGIAPPSGASHVDGRIMRIYNVGSYNITLKHNSTSSSIANRFCCVQAIDIVLGPRDFAELIYDATDGGLVSGQNNPCWRVA